MRDMLEKKQIVNPFKIEMDQLIISSPKGYNIKSYYIDMRDGIKIALDVHLPTNNFLKNKLTTILIQTRYWRSVKLRFPFNFFIKNLAKKDYTKAFISYGFAVVIVDVRGTGASYGYRDGPWSESEILDNKEILDWIILQPWSNGNVIAFGNSYAGTTAELVSVVNHPAVKGYIVMHNEIDPYSDIAFPGGIFNEWFVSTWSHYNNCLDNNKTKDLGFLVRIMLKSVKKVDDDNQGKLLKEAVKSHRKNVDVLRTAQNIEYRDDQWDNKTLKDFSVYNYIPRINHSKVPIYYWGSWMDAATANVVIESFLTFDNPLVGVIGAWTHGAILNANPYCSEKKEVNPNYPTQYRSYIQFINNCLEKPYDIQRILFYYTMGEERWKKTNTWPPRGQSKERWYFSENNKLSIEKSDDDYSYDVYKIDFRTTSGTHNRWYTQMGGDSVYYSNRRKQDKFSLTYTSPPLIKDLEITGYPIINIYLSSTHEDGALFIYLEDVNEKGEVKYITEGQIRLIHRKLSIQNSFYKTMIPFHTYMKKDSLPVKPGEIMEVKFGLFPTSVLIRKNHKLRISIAGADKDTFVRIPSSEDPTLKIFRNKSYPSFIEIPVMKNL